MNACLRTNGVHPAKNDITNRWGRSSNRVRANSANREAGLTPLAGRLPCPAPCRRQKGGGSSGPPPGWPVPAPRGGPGPGVVRVPHSASFGPGRFRPVFPPPHAFARPWREPVPFRGGGRRDEPAPLEKCPAAACPQGAAGASLEVVGRVGCSDVRGCGAPCSAAREGPPAGPPPRDERVPL